MSATANHVNEFANRIICGDALRVLKTFPDESVDCVVTSPPYWALRDYGVEGQLGLESTFDGYVMRLCHVFDEVKRVLKPQGTCWVNLGDTYVGKGPTRHMGYADPKNRKVGVTNYVEPSALPQSVPEKCLSLVPFRFAVEMVRRGWILRNVIIWHKPNAMPSSAKDRFTVDFEYLFFFVESKDYWFCQQLDPVKASSLQRARYGLHTDPRGPWAINVRTDRLGARFVNPRGRNRRCVWTIATKGFRGPHFAVYPVELVRTPILAGCPEEVCRKCGASATPVSGSGHDRGEEAA